MDELKFELDRSPRRHGRASASAGYPGNVVSGKKISGLEAAAEMLTSLFSMPGHAGKMGEVLSNGGRVLAVDRPGRNDRGGARSRLRSGREIDFDGCQLSTATLLSQRFRLRSRRPMLPSPSLSASLRFSLPARSAAQTSRDPAPPRARPHTGPRPAPAATGSEALSPRRLQKAMGLIRERFINPAASVERNCNAPPSPACSGALIAE